MGLVELYWRGFTQLGLSGAKLAHWALAEAGCTEPWVGSFAPAHASRLVTHAAPYVATVPVVDGDVLLRWTHPHGADAVAGCVVHVSGDQALVYTTSTELWCPDDPTYRWGHLRWRELRGMVKV